MELHPVPLVLAAVVELVVAGYAGWQLHARHCAQKLKKPEPASNGEAVIARLDELAKTLARRKLTAHEAAELKVLLAMKEERERAKKDDPRGRVVEG